MSSSGSPTAMHVTILSTASSSRSPLNLGSVGSFSKKSENTYSVARWAMAMAAARQARPGRTWYCRRRESCAAPSPCHWPGARLSLSLCLPPRCSRIPPAFVSRCLQLPATPLGSRARCLRRRRGGAGRGGDPSAQVPAVPPRALSRCKSPGRARHSDSRLSRAPAGAGTTRETKRFPLALRLRVAPAAERASGPALRSQPAARRSSGTIPGNRVPRGVELPETR